MPESRSASNCPFRTPYLHKQFAYLCLRHPAGKLTASKNSVLNRIVQPLCISPGPRQAPRSAPTRSARPEVTLIKGRELSAADFSVWHELQQSNPDLANPCFAPEFTQAVAAVRA